jgi:mannose-1-phosphate guanylyltransferase
MGNSEHVWVLLLGAGEGRRAQAITRDHHGRSAPKQYCAFADGTPFGASLRRARALTTTARIVPIVASEQRRWWEPELTDIPTGNIIVQPYHRGTAVGALIAFLEVFRRDPSARILLFPAGHSVREEETLHRSLEQAMNCVDAVGDHAVILGVAPNGEELDLDWILPMAGGGEVTCGVAGYASASSSETARSYMERGALWSTMILAATTGAFLSLYRHSVPWLLSSMLLDLGGAEEVSTGRIQSLYETLPGRDLSSDVFERAPDHLRMLEVPGCGWTDLGTPSRINRHLSARVNGRV